ncbi:MAG: allophanate hydrolase subunit 1 [Lachnospiraceae bacterium]|nr:allophanate hydrolase subunit 1 [Lachnospiraceae bacterium]
MDIKVLITGDRGISVQVGEEISLEVNSRVLTLWKALQEHPVEGITEMLPTYAALMIHYRPEVIRFAELKERIEELAAGLTAENSSMEKIIKEVPICYEGELAPDLELCAELEHTTTAEVIRKHSAHDYYVFMLGFAPGHPYSARFEEPFSFKRRETARVKIPGRSVVVQQNLSDLIPFDQPCGWNIIGTTPLTICDYTKEDPFLVRAGEWVRYIPVNRAEYDRIQKQVEDGTYQVVVHRE